MELPENATNQPQVSDASLFRNRAIKKDQPVVIELPSGLFVSIKRPSVTAMVRSGVIPSEVALAMQVATPGKPLKGDDLIKSLELLDIVAANSIVEPKVLMSGEPKDGEILVSDLEDLDKQFIMNYVQSGVANLKPFRPVVQR